MHTIMEFCMCYRECYECADPLPLPLEGTGKCRNVCSLKREKSSLQI